MNEKWSSLSIEEIEQKLKTSAASGLSPKAARSRCEKMPTPFFTVKRKRIDMMLLDIVRDFFLIMLIMVAILAPIFEGEFVFGIAIVAIYVISLALSLSVYYLERRGMESMSDFFSPTARVIRGGKLYIADYREVVLGDVKIGRAHV